MNKPSKRIHSIVRGIVLGAVAFAVIGCARSAEFTAPDQPGASHQNTYPNFSIRPKAATQQFSENEKQALTSKLDSEATSLKKMPGSSAKKISNLATMKEDARREAEETIREIEQNGRELEKSGNESEQSDK